MAQHCPVSVGTSSSADPRAHSGSRGRARSLLEFGPVLATGRSPTAHAALLASASRSRKGPINAKRRGADAVTPTSGRASRSRVDSRSHAFVSSVPRRFQRMVRRVPPLPTARERSVCAPVPPPTAYSVLELGRSSVSKAFDVPRRRAAEIRIRTTAALPRRWTRRERRRLRPR
jgi:hypothetical protein